MKVRVVSPATGMLAVLQERAKRAEAALSRLGFSVSYGEHAFDASQGWMRAGSATGRAADLMAAFEDDDVDIIFSAEAGIGSSEVLEFLDPTVIARHKKPFVGFCDNAAISMFLLNECKLASLYGYAFLPHFGEAGGPFLEVENYFKDAVKGDASLKCEPLNSRASGRIDFFDEQQERRVRERDTVGGFTWLRRGVARGRVIAAEISVAADIFRDFKVDMAGSIFMWDVAYHGADVAPFLQRLAEDADLSGISAMIVGRNPAVGAERWVGEIRDLITEFFPDLSCPVIVNGDLSHLSPSWIVPFGEMGVLQADGSLLFERGRDLGRAGTTGR